MWKNAKILGFLDVRFIRLRLERASKDKRQPQMNEDEMSRLSVRFIHSSCSWPNHNVSSGRRKRHWFVRQQALISISDDLYRLHTLTEDRALVLFILSVCVCAWVCVSALIGLISHWNRNPKKWDESKSAYRDSWQIAEHGVVCLFVQTIELPVEKWTLSASCICETAT